MVFDFAEQLYEWIPCGRDVAEKQFLGGGTHLAT